MYNGSGSFSRVHNWQQDSANNIDITDSRCDAEDDGFATGLSTAICKDGQTTVTADIPFANHKLTGIANGTVRTDAAAVGQVQDGALNWVAAGGTADAITATYSPAHTALTDGLECKFRAGAANATTTPTFAPDGLTAHTITKQGGLALIAGDIPATLAEVILRYNLAHTRWELLNPSSQAIPSGMIAPFAASSSPTGWLICDGSAVSRTTYAALFAAVSTTYGTGDGSTTFNLPDLRGRSIFGVDNMGGTAANRVTNAISGVTGTTLGAAGGDQRSQQHNHTATDSGHTHATVASGVFDAITAGNSDTYAGGGTNFFAPTAVSNLTGTNTGSGTASITVANTGAGSSQNIPPAMMLNYIIKT